ncbi:Ig domain-containing protein [Embleya sp. NPDC050493]|uniref:Ig domain-containing protein n=1 Tax=Embleya sp. NPDC050493 TaxID=3363989 RepID=UPI0037BCE864
MNRSRSETHPGIRPPIGVRGRFDRGRAAGGTGAARAVRTAAVVALATEAIPGGPSSVSVADPGAQASRFDQRVNLVLGVSGGTGPYSCAGRGLPAGLFLNPLTCVITGRAWGVGTFAVEVTATDSTGAKAGTSFRWTVSWF